MPYERKCGERHERGRPVCHIWHPLVIAVAPGEYGGYGKRCCRMTGGESTAVPAEPSSMVVRGGCEAARARSLCDGLQSRGDEFRLKKGFAGFDRGLLGI